MKKTERERILDAYSKAFKKYINPTYIDKKGLLDDRTKEKDGKTIYASYSKIDGNIFAHIIKEEIDDILNKEYHVSVNNAYIEGCFTEWDLLIYKGKQPKYNIYKPENVICAIELKAGGLAGYNKNDDIKDFFEKVKESLKQCSMKEKIKFLYISLNDSENKSEIIDEVIKENGFYSYFVTVGSWHYKDWSNNTPPAKTDTRKGTTELKEIINKIIKSR